MARFNLILSYPELVESLMELQFLKLLHDDGIFIVGKNFDQGKNKEKVDGHKTINTLFKIGARLVK